MGAEPTKPVISNDVNRMCSEITVFFSKLPSTLLGIRYIAYALADNDIAISYCSMLKEGWIAGVDESGNTYYCDITKNPSLKYSSAPPTPDFLMLEQKRLGTMWAVTYNVALGRIEYTRENEVRYTPPRNNKVFKTMRINRTRLVHIYLALKPLMMRSIETLEKEELCSICYDAKVNVVLACGHSFCDSCIINWSQHHSFCPSCKQKLEENWMNNFLNTPTAIVTEALKLIENTL